MAEVSSQTLHLVARELASELNEARAALETFGEQQDNIALLRKCGEHLHSVHGALRVAEVYGAALLAEEMGQVTRYLLEHFAEKRHLAEGLDALMRAMVQLPTYLDRVLNGGRDMALVLLPLLNDLRAVRGHALLSEGTLLLLNLSSDRQASPAPATPGDGSFTVTQWARRLRTRFQLGLLGWIKGERVEQNLEALSRAAEKLELLATTQPVFQLWWVVGAVLESLREHGLEGSASVKRLLGQADRELKRLYEQGEARYAKSPPLDLLNNLLYYVARARSAGPRVTAVRASFRLSELLPVDDQVEQARESLSAPSVKLMKTVAAAIKEDLSRVKDALDIFVRQGGTQVDDLSPQLELLKKIADTLGVLGLGELRDKVQTETMDLQAIVVRRTPVNEGTLLRMAATLIKVEDSLDGQLVSMIVPISTAETAPQPTDADDIEFRQVAEAVLRECIVNMARIKESIALSTERPGESQTIEQLPQLVRGITAGLLMLGKSRVVAIMEGIDRALSQFMRSDGLTLPPEAVDRLADAIVAVEYYMETLQAGRADPWYMLDNAETCLRYLAESQPVARVKLPPDAAHVHTLILEPLSQTVATPTEYERTAVLGHPAPVAAAAAVRMRTEDESAPMPPSIAPPADREIDPEFLELFIEEAKDEIVRLQQFFPRWDENPQEQEALTNIRRSFHTLKGSGRMVGAQLIGEFAWSIENLLNRVINKTLERTPNMMSLFREAIAAVPELVEQLEAGRAPRADIGRIVAQAYTLAGGRPAAPNIPNASPRNIARPPSLAAKAAGAPGDAAAFPDDVPEPPTLTTTAIVDLILATPDKKTPWTSVPRSAGDPPMEPALSEIYIKETAGHLASIRQFIAGAEANAPPYIVSEDLHRSCHTLSGTAKTAGARQGIKIAEPLNRYIRKLYDNSTGLSAAGLAALKDAVAAIQQIVEHINADTGFFPSHARVVARINELERSLDGELSRFAGTVGAATSVIAAGAPSRVMPPDALPRNDTAAFDAAVASAAPEPANGDESDVVELPSIEASALGMLEWSFDNFPDEPAPLAAASNAAPTEEIAPIVLDEGADLQDSTRALDELMIEDDAQEIALDASVAAAFEKIDARLKLEAAPSADFGAPRSDQDFDFGFLTEAERQSSPQIDISPFTELQSAPDAVLREEAETVSGLVFTTTPAAALVSGQRDADFDPDIAAIFTDEASELLEAADNALAAWMRDQGNNALVFELKRSVHTLKGGARMAGIRAMGDLSHELETFMQRVEAGQVPASAAAFATLQASLDELHRMRDVVSGGGRNQPAHELMARIRALGGEGPGVQEPTALAAVAAPSSVTPQADLEEHAMFTAHDIAAQAPELPPVSQGADTEPALEFSPHVPALPPGREAIAQERQEFARVDADLLDTLLNNAGEVSIFRSRLEQQISSIEFNLAELGRTVTRLREQLRKLELETEAQILHRHQEEHPERAGFDPLELDRYSTIQQLTRAFAESVSDVGSIEGLLENLTREGQNLLLQQSRVVSELQNGLMRTRMVPFQRHVQRLSRLVRQVASETGKQADLVVTGAAGELDRQVLERMLPPFEHMLRNAVVHGIEASQERLASGKPASGTIKVGLHREGSEMIIVLEDDGRGIDVQAVRARAAARGLLHAGRELSDEETLQLILEPGFSTASSITQHAGRGVGMDVVVTEIKKLGGALLTQSTPGHGVKFTIRLPFTLAITQALIVRTGEELYALPLPTVEGVVRMPKVEVQQHLTEDISTFNYGGQIYRLAHLGAFIGGGPSVLPEAEVPVPLILIRAGEHSTAIVVDELVGSREMVVKSVGPQIATIRGISGATILGDGRIVIILDMGALVRSEWRARRQLAVQGPAIDKRTFALVVDDSITVRRVTQRLLERHGMRVMTAKDGIDALSILQEHVPDVILLDIEMPRMDGYELAAQVRADARLADLPIVMITSRVGEKHRARAIELGVNDYLGKPYQENELLDAIEPLVEARRQKAL